MSKKNDEDELVTKGFLKQHLKQELDKVMAKLDSIAKMLKDMYEEQTVASHQIAEHSDQLENHEGRIKKLETTVLQ